VITETECRFSPVQSRFQAERVTSEYVCLFRLLFLSSIMDIIKKVELTQGEKQLSLFTKPVIHLNEYVKGYQLKRYLKRLNRLKNAK